MIDLSAKQNWFKVLPILLILVSFFLLLLPNFSLLLAEDSSIVPCKGLDCTTCDFIRLGNNGIIWLLGIIFMIFAVLMTIAGFGLVTSGGNQSALAAAKTKFQNALIGIIIVLAAWLIVDTVLRGLLKSGDLSVFNNGNYSGWGPWAQIECIPNIVPFYDQNVTPSPGQVDNSTSTPPTDCTVPPLSVINDSKAMEMERGNPVVFSNPTLQACATKFIGLVGGGAKVNSAYRPQAYQTHLWEIKDRWCPKSQKGTYNLREDNNPACSTLKAAVQQEVVKHFKSTSWDCGEVAKANSTHSSGIGVDIGGIDNHGSPTIQQKATESCLIWKNYNNDRWHYDLKSGCSCSP